MNFKKSFLVLPFILVAITTAHAVTVSLNSANEGGNSIFSGELLETSCAKIGVVMYHGRGLSPVGPVVEEIQNSLYRTGYTTLSIENPVPLNGLTDFTSYVNDVGTDNYVFPEAYARMRAAINHLQLLGVEEVIVAGFSFGSRLATAHVARGQIDELPIIGLIGIGMYGTSIEPLNVSTTLDEVPVPVIDIYGDADTNAANTAFDRLSSYNTGDGVDYTQTVIPCIGGLNCHQLEGLKGDDSMPLEINISAWMQAVAPASLVIDCMADTAPVTTQPTSGSGSGAFNAYLTLLYILLLPVIRVIRYGNNQQSRHHCLYGVVVIKKRSLRNNDPIIYRLFDVVKFFRTYCDDRCCATQESPLRCWISE
jgi:dienelactone hydrolase